MECDEQFRNPDVRKLDDDWLYKYSNPSAPEVWELDGRNGGRKRKCNIVSKSGKEVTVLYRVSQQ